MMFSKLVRDLLQIDIWITDLQCSAYGGTALQISALS